MGEYAEMEVFAQMRGKTSSDLSVRELTDFYREYDGKPVMPPRPTRCHCGKGFKTRKGLHAHQRAVHGQP